MTTIFLALSALISLSPDSVTDRPAAEPTAGGPSRVLIIGLDGVRSDALRRAPTPNIDALIRRGAVSWNALAGGGLSTSDPTHQATSSGPGWASILTGVWVDKHGVVDNSFAGNNLANYPHFFWRVGLARIGANLASIVHWDPINTYLVPTFPLASPFVQQLSSDVATTNAAAVYLTTSNPDVLFVHLDDGDHAGHAYGFSPGIPEYLAAISQLDVHVGTILAALYARPNYATEDWLVLMTTDHGGRGTSHGGHSASERQTWMIAAGGATSNTIIDPGPGMTSIARTALEHLGISIEPWWQLADTHAFAQPRALPYSPSPRDPESGVGVDVTLRWASAKDAVDYTVYLGAAPGLSAADRLGTTTQNGWSPGRLAPATTFHWRVDTTTAGGVRPGTEWTFTTAGSILDELVLHADFQRRTADASMHVPHIVGGRPAYVAGQEGAAISIDAGDEYVSFGSPAELAFGATTDFSASLWVRSDGFSGDPVFLGNKNWNSGSNTGWVIAGDSRGNWQWNYRGANGSRLDHDLAGVIADGAWHHIAVTHDRDGLVSFYQDGAWLTSGELASPGSIDALATVVGQDGTRTYGIGNNAEFDEVRMWRRALSASEVDLLWASGPGERWRRLVGGSAGAHGVSVLRGAGPLTSGSFATVFVSSAAPHAPAALFLGDTPLNLPLFGALLAPNPIATASPLATDALGRAVVPFQWLASQPAGTQFWFQMWSIDAANPSGLAASNPLMATTP